jgi:hypothetical protein
MITPKKSTDIYYQDQMCPQKISGVQKSPNEVARFSKCRKSEYSQNLWYPFNAGTNSSVLNCLGMQDASRRPLFPLKSGWWK